MYRRYNKVTRKGCFDGNIDSFVITDFSYHDDIWILTQSSTETCGKAISDIWKNLRLIESIDLVFYWIFKGEYGPGETTNGLLPVRPAAERPVS